MRNYQVWSSLWEELVVQGKLVGSSIFQRLRLRHNHYYQRFWCNRGRRIGGVSRIGVGIGVTHWSWAWNWAREWAWRWAAVVVVVVDWAEVVVSWTVGRLIVVVGVVVSGFSAFF